MMIAPLAISCCPYNVNLVTASALVNACCYSNGSALDRVILWIHGNWPLWDQEPNNAVSGGAERRTLGGLVGHSESGAE
jgi:hypothetical protein